MTFNADLSRRDLMAVAATLIATVPARNVLADTQPTPLATSGAGPKIVKGTVFESRSGARERQASDPGIGGVLVSNGREVVRTGGDGGYDLPIEDGMAVFVIKPSDYAVPLDAGTNLPRFSYIHQPEGTPAGLDLIYPGLAPTGPLPESVDFALIRSKEPRHFDAVLFTDPQPESNAEIDFIRDDVVAGLNGIEAAFGITAGDIMFDELSLYGRYNAIIGQIGLPWWNIGGNHDLNFESPNARTSRETYKRVFGANYYAFEYGDTLFLMLDNVDCGARRIWSRPSSIGRSRSLASAAFLAALCGGCFSVGGLLRCRPATPLWPSAWSALISCNPVQSLASASAFSRCNARCSSIETIGMRAWTPPRILPCALSGLRAWRADHAGRTERDAIGDRHGSAIETKHTMCVADQRQSPERSPGA
jgi:hypothetical protein